MSSADEMWGMVRKSFEYHRRPADPNAQSALDRVAMKCLGLAERKSFHVGNCFIREETLSQEALWELVVYHDRDQPAKMEGPIVVLNYKGRPFVIEGNTRTNAWRKGKYAGPFTALILEPTDHAA
jgi:hypothetical protein